MTLPQDHKDREYFKFIETSDNKVALRVKLHPDSYTVLDGRYMKTDGSNASATVNMSSTTDFSTSSAQITQQTVGPFVQSQMKFLGTYGFVINNNNNTTILQNDLSTTWLSASGGNIRLAAQAKTLEIGTTVDIDTRRIINVSDPTSAQDAATKNYLTTYFVPYTGATTDTNIGAHKLTAGNLEAYDYFTVPAGTYIMNGNPISLAGNYYFFGLIGGKKYYKNAAGCQLFQLGGTTYILGDSLGNYDYYNNSFNLTAENQTIVMAKHPNTTGSPSSVTITCHSSIKAESLYIAGAVTPISGTLTVYGNVNAYNNTLSGWNLTTTDTAAIGSSLSVGTYATVGTYLNVTGTSDSVSAAGASFNVYHTYPLLTYGIFQDVPTTLSFTPNGYFWSSTAYPCAVNNPGDGNIYIDSANGMGSSFTDDMTNVYDVGMYSSMGTQCSILYIFNSNDDLDYTGFYNGDTFLVAPDTGGYNVNPLGLVTGGTPPTVNLANAVPPAGYELHYRIYAYRLINGVKYYASTYTEVTSLIDSTASGFLPVINLSPGAGGADGYLIFKGWYDTFNYLWFDYFTSWQETTSTLFVDNSSGWTGGAHDTYPKTAFSSTNSIGGNTNLLGDVSIGNPVGVTAPSGGLSIGFDYYDGLGDFVGVGLTYYARVYSYRDINGSRVYSSTYLEASPTPDPNDSTGYYLVLSGFSGSADADGYIFIVSTDNWATSFALDSNNVYYGTYEFNQSKIIATPDTSLTSVYFNGNLTVHKNETITGTLGVSGLITASAGVSFGGTAATFYQSSGSDLAALISLTSYSGSNSTIAKNNGGGWVITGSANGGSFDLGLIGSTYSGARPNGRTWIGTSGAPTTDAIVGIGADTTASNPFFRVMVDGTTPINRAKTGLATDNTYSNLQNNGSLYLNRATEFYTTASNLGSVTGNNLRSMAMSSDGTIVYAGFTALQKSTNSGRTFGAGLSGITGRFYNHSVACSSDGQTVIVVNYDGYPKLSTNGGTSWTTLSAALPSGSWTSAAMSYDGATIVLGRGNSASAWRVALSTDGGTNWTDKTSASGIANGVNFVSVGVSGNGQVILAGIDGTASIKKSTDQGATWSAIAPTGLGSNGFQKFALSNDGAVICFTNCSYYNNSAHQLFFSTDTGGTWSRVGVTTTWTDAFVSSDGNVIHACASGYFISSFDKGVTWVYSNLPNSTINCIVASTDGLTNIMEDKYYGKVFNTIYGVDGTFTKSVTSEAGKLEGVYFTQTADKTIANTVTETTMIGAGVGTVTLPANLLIAGRTVRIKAKGYFSTTGNPNITFKAKYGSTVLVDSGASAAGNNVTNQGFTIEIVGTCRTTGATGTIYTQGYAQLFAAHGTPSIFDLETTSAVTINTTASTALNLTATWGTASASNTITVTNMTVEILN